MIAIIDYDMGNIHSVQKALESFGAKTIVTNKAKVIETCDKVVLPGVGAFDDAITELKKNNLIPVLHEHIKSNKTFLGICLGMQLLFGESLEAKHAKGLGVFKGKIVKFKYKGDLKVPHIGWNELKKQRDKCPLLRGIPDKSYVYFCHSYYPQPLDNDVVAATTEYAVEFASVLWKDNIYGVQFHPEKSQNIGLKIIKNFLEI